MLAAHICQPSDDWERDDTMVRTRLPRNRTHGGMTYRSVGEERAANQGTLLVERGGGVRCRGHAYLAPHTRQACGRDALHYSILHTLFYRPCFAIRRALHEVCRYSLYTYGGARSSSRLHQVLGSERLRRPGTRSSPAVRHDPESFAYYTRPVSNTSSIRCHEAGVGRSVGRGRAITPLPPPSIQSCIHPASRCSP